MRLLALSLAVLLPALAGAEDLVGRVRERATARGLSPAEVEELATVVAQTQATGLPPEPVTEKILEGLAKGAPVPRVVAAAQAVGARLSDARGALERAGLPGESRAVAALALAESRLSSPEVLNRLAERSRGASAEALVAATGAVAELQASGVAPEAACEAVGGLAARGYRADQLAAVPRLYGQFRAEGGRDDAAFWAELGRRSEVHQDLRDVVDPFGKGGNVLIHADRAAPGRSEEAPGRAAAEQSTGGSIFENPDRAGSTPANDQVVPGPPGGSPPGKPASKSNNAGGNGNGKGKGPGSGNTNGNGHQNNP